MKQPFERLLVGRTLADRYELHEVIGAGGMSVVFRGTDRTLGRPVAVKVISLPADSEAMRDNLRERFRREAGSAARIPPHPNVVQVYDYGTDPELDLDFLVMELLRGRDLKERLALGVPPMGEALRVLLEAARGLAAGHRTGIVHRDVKPANVFLVGDERLEAVRLLDFGIAKPMEPGEDDGLTTLGQLPHSPAYAAPEQLDPDQPVGPQSDVYQLGLIGYELLTGERAFSEGERKRIAAGEEIALVATPRWSGVPEPVRAVIARALRTPPEERYADAGEFASAIAEAEDHTVLQPAAAPAPVEAAEIAAPPPVVETRPAAAPVVVEPPRVGVPVTGGSAAKRRVSPALWLVPAALLALLVLFLATRKKGDEERTASAAPAPVPTAPDTGERAALDDTFLRLEGEVAASRAAAQAAAREVADSAPADGGVSESSSPPDAGAAAQAVQDEIVDLNKAWMNGDLDRHVAHYADRVDYYSEDNATRAFIRADRGRDLRKYDRREMSVLRQAVTFPEPGRARALVDKKWTFQGSGERWDGSMRQEMILRKEGDRWLIISEQPNEVYYSRKTRI